MFELLNEQPADKILSLAAAYRADTRATKVDLGVGVYKDATGKTPVMRSVKAAEARLLETQDSKAYTSLAGDPAFSDAMIGLILGDTVPRNHIASVATPGGTGAVRQALELIRMANPEARIWLSNPTWPNHNSIVKYLGMPTQSYRYFDEASGGIDFDGMLADLRTVAAGDVVLFHGCCHNPTGANLTPDQLSEAIKVLQEQGAVAMVDIAYQGFGDGLAADAEATRTIAQSFDNVLIAASCSKNFGVYRERTGCLMAVCRSEAERGLTQANLAFLNRQNYSFPPDHGARVVTTILGDDGLRADWEAELEEIRVSMLGLRQQLADELRRATNSDRFDFVAEHRGMFSRLGLEPAAIDALREDHGIYVVGDSRINVAGLNAQTVPLLASAVASVLT